LTAAPLFRPIDIAPAYQKVADAIEREIVNGRIKPGDPIGTELELGRQFGVNRSTVREGIRVLEEGGLIRRDSSRRLQACLPRYNKLATRLSRALVLQEVTFREIYEASTMLEVATSNVRWSAPRLRTSPNSTTMLSEARGWSRILHHLPNSTQNSIFYSPKLRRTGCCSLPGSLPRSYFSPPLK
jgi:DNA-binding transcriptional regulator YhcF (GntR family)